MKDKINIAELLKDCPKGMELDCTMFDDVVFDRISVEPNTHPIYIKVKNCDLIVQLTKYGQYMDINDAKCVIFPKGKTTWEGFHIPFKVGDIVFTTLGNIAIIRKPIGGELFYVYGVMVGNGFYKDETSQVVVERLATEEEKELLFRAIEKNGYKWDEETKTLEKLIPNKFDITTLVPFESRVLVRVSNIQIWVPTFWGKYLKNDSNYGYLTTNGCYKYCIPYEGNEHLLGTNDDCDEYFKTWK